MDLLNDAYLHHRRALGDSLFLPEYRQLDLYATRRKLSFQDPIPEVHRLQAHLLHSVRLLQAALDDHLHANDPLLSEGVRSWQRYLALPRSNATEKMVAEVYRILRIVRIATTRANAHVQVDGGIVRLACTFDRCALSLSISEAGLGLLGSFVLYYLESFHQPYGAAYVEWMLSQYFTDLMNEIKRFADEDRILYQFQPRPYFSRHFRFDCDNPNTQQDDTHYQFEIGKFHNNPVVFPIDFFVVIHDALHIVPIEATQSGKIAADSLSKWKARGAVDTALPARFRGRFVREHMVVGLPMT